MSPLSFSRRVIFRVAILALLFAGLAFSSMPATAANDSIVAVDTNIRAFHLVSEGRGWLWMGQQLYRTDDNGANWLNSTPPNSAEIMDAVFLDDSTAWVILNQDHPTQFTLANTSDGGDDWTFSTHNFSELAQQPSAVANIYMGWHNAQQGWLVFKFATGSNFSVGLLYTTQDAGLTWQMHTIPLGEPALFTDAQNGWVAGGPAGKLYSTSNGGETWEERTPAQNAYFQLPIFLHETNGVLPAIVTDEPARAEFFQTDDAGQTRTSAGSVPLEADTPSDTPLPISVLDATRFTFIVPNSDRIVSMADGHLSEIQNSEGQSAGIVALDMVSAQSGWGQWTTGNCVVTGKLGDSLGCTRETKLLSTRDGGLTWDAISLPGVGGTSILENFPASSKTNTGTSLSALAMSDADTKAYVGQGFDKCEIPTATQMQKWWTSSPYNAVNLYIGGSARACYNGALSSSFVSQLNTQGWRFIPTWVGPQASCTGYASRMSSDPIVAYDQGVAEADLAVTTAINLGLAEADGSGTVIYYDLEAYDTSNANCRSAANAFISGWVAQMHAYNNLGGVYGASCASAVSDWANIANVPDALWIANWYGNAGSVSYRQSASVWGAYCLSDSLWPNHQRLRQYAGGHNETWGGITLGIDSNVIDGPLTVSNGTGGASAPGQPINQGPAHGTAFVRTNDTWLTWKTTGDSCSLHIWGGSMDSTVSGSCSFYHLGVKPGGAYSWQVTATNSVGSTVGPVWQFTIKPYAASSLSIGSVAATKVNLNWQLSADDPANVDGYNIYKDGVNIASVNKSVASYQATNLACNSSYSFFVKAVRQGVESDASNTATGTTTTCAPALVSPTSGQVLENRRPSFQWQSVDVATAYQIQVSPYANLSGLSLNTQVATLTYSMTKDLASNTTYYWRVRGVGPFGNGDWSIVQTFKTANPPSLPGLSGPANGGLTTNYAPKLNWTDSTLPTGIFLDHYQMQLASDNAFSTILYDETTSASEFVVPVELTPNTKYYWHVRAFNTLGQYTSWTSTWSFRTAVLPPILELPTNDTLFDHTRPTLDWSDVDTATKYTLQISRYLNFRSVLVSRSSLTSQYTFTTDLPRSALLYWRVRTEAANGPSKWSDVRWFTTGNPPGTPSLLSPATNALLTSYQPKLDWSDVPLFGGTVLDHYQIQIATETSFATPTLDASVLPSQYIPITPLDANMKYYWRVRAFNTLGHYSAWSKVSYFRTAILPPVLVAPGNNAVLGSPPFQFSWDAVDGATNYTIQVSTTSSFSTRLVNTTVSVLTYTPTVTLPKGIPLYWRVRANGANGPSLWSSVYQFTIP